MMFMNTKIYIIYYYLLGNRFLGKQIIKFMFQATPITYQKELKFQLQDPYNYTNYMKLISSPYTKTILKEISYFS